MAQVENAKEGLTVRQVAERLGVSYQTVHNWINSGRLPVTRFGARIIRIHPDDLEQVRTTS